MDRDDKSKLAEILRSGSQRYIKADVLAASTLREAIIKGVLAPGEDIDEEMVARNLNISRMPVRQAMGILEAEGLVHRIYRKRVIVTELKSADIEELFHIRAHLEGLAIKRAIPHLAETDFQKLKACLEELEKCSEDASSYLEINDKFHAIIYASCGWDRLLGLIKQLRNNAGRYMILARDALLAHEFIIINLDKTVGHKRILEVCEEKNPEQAELTMRNHILRAMEVLLNSFNRTIARNSLS